MDDVHEWAGSRRLLMENAVEYSCVESRRCSMASGLDSQWTEDSESAPAISGLSSQCFCFYAVQCAASNCKHHRQNGGYEIGADMDRPDWKQQTQRGCLTGDHELLCGDDCPISRFPAPGAKADDTGCSCGRPEHHQPGCQSHHKTKQFVDAEPLAWPPHCREILTLLTVQCCGPAKHLSSNMATWLLWLLVLVSSTPNHVSGRAVSYNVSQPVRQPFDNVVSAVLLFVLGLSASFL